MRKIAPLAALLVMTPMLASAAPPQSQVTIVNTPSNPVPVSGNVNVSQPELQAIQLHCNAVNCEADDVYHPCTCLFPSIPSGKLLVIETIGLYGVEEGALSPVPVATFVTNLNGALGSYGLPVRISMSNENIIEFTSTSSFRLYADSSIAPPAIWLRNLIAHTWAINGYISGYYLDKP